MRNLSSRTLSLRSLAVLALMGLPALPAAGCASRAPESLAGTSPARIEDGDAVRIVSVASGKVLDVVGGSTADGAPLQQWGYGGGRNQAWRLHRDSSGRYTIANLASGSCLDTPAGGGDGARLQQWGCADQDNQRWSLRPAEDGSFTLVSAATGKCVDVAGASSDDGAAIQQWACAGSPNQRWRIEPVSEIDPSLVGVPVALVSVRSGKVLDVVGARPDDGATIQQWSDAGASNQRWTLVPAGGGAYAIVGANGGKCLDVEGGSAADGVRLLQWSCSGGASAGANQRWTLRSMGGGAYAIVSSGSGKCVDVAGASTDNGAALQQWRCSGGDNQAFVLRGGGAATPAPPPSPATSDASLRAAAAASGKWIGVAVSASRLGDARYTSTAASEFDYVTPENEMKWDATEPQPGQFDFGGGDAVARFAAGHGMRVKGHALVWHNQLPAWAEALTDPAAVRAAMGRHVSTVASHYRGQVAAWDVVNEAIDDAPSHGIRDDVFHRAMGDGYIAEAFRIAHEADPGALLFYNDYGIEGLDGKADAMYALVKRLVEAGVPIAGVGLQTHIGVNDGASTSDIKANMRRIGALGLLVNVSELDVSVCAVRGGPAAKLAAQRTRMHDVMAACMAEPQCPSVTLWGVADRDSWLNTFAPCAGGDEGSPWPLLFDDGFARKPAWQGVVDALRGR